MGTQLRRASRSPVRHGGRRRAIGAVEALDRRVLLAAHIVGSPTVYATIQAAVTAAAAGATITVGPGTYAEQVTVSKPLTIQGSQAGVDGATRVGGSTAGESIVSGAVSSGVHSCAFHVTANDVVIDGFTVQGETDASDTTGAGIVIAPKVSGTHVLNNVVRQNVAGLFLANYSATDAAVIQHNYFGYNNNAGGNSGRGIYTDGTISGGNLTDVTIDSNTFVGNYGTDGVEAACAFQATAAGEQSNIQITHNVMAGNGKATLFFNTTGVVITDNTITGSIDSGSAALRFEGDNHTVTIQHNTADGNTAPAVAIDAKGTPGDSSGFVINGNNFYGNNTAFGPAASVVYVPSTYTGTLDVRSNWWGDPSGPGHDGPGTGDAVSAASLQVSPVEKWTLTTGGTELYSPWLAAPYSATPTLPTAPANLAATLATAGQVNLAWTDTAPGNETGFVVERSTDGVTFAQISTVAAGVTRYADTAGLVVGTTYDYRVAAVNALGDSPYSGVAAVTVTATVSTYVSDLPWVSATIGWGSIGLDQSVGGNPLTLRGTRYAKGIGTHAVSRIVYALNGQYTSFSSDVGVDDEENAKGVGSVDFQVLGDGAVLFDSGVLTNASPVVHVNVGVTGVTQLTLLATNGVAGSIDYDHADWAGATLVSTAVTPTVPAAPTGLVATASPTQVSLAWTDNARGNEAGFVVLRSADGFTYSPIGTTATGVTTYADTGGLSVGTTYSYQVIATNAVGNSAASNVATATVPAVTSPNRFTLTALPAAATAGGATAVTLKVLDANGNVVSGYTGVVHFASTDRSALLPADYTFTAADAGSHTFAVTFKTAGAQTVSVTDVATLKATSSAVAVKAAAAVRATLVAPASVMAKMAFSVTVILYDAYGNVATGYVGTVQFTSSDRSASLPSSYTFTATDAGTHTFKATLKTRGTQTLVLADKTNSALRASVTIAVH